MPVEGLAESITLAVALGDSAKSVDQLLDLPAPSKSASARELILDILEAEGEQESDALDARVAAQTGLSARTMQNARVELGRAGLAKSFPTKDEHGAVVCWNVHRTGAERS